ncbi:unnamed protein product [Prunus armeniaca]
MRLISRLIYLVCYDLRPEYYDLLSHLAMNIIFALPLIYCLRQILEIVLHDRDFVKRIIALRGGDRDLELEVEMGTALATASLSGN